MTDVCFNLTVSVFAHTRVSVYGQADGGHTRVSVYGQADGGHTWLDVYANDDLVDSLSQSATRYDSVGELSQVYAKCDVWEMVACQQLMNTYLGQP